MTLSFKVKKNTHDSDKFGTSYHYDIENGFHVKALYMNEQIDIHTSSSKQEFWASDEHPVRRNERDLRDAESAIEYARREYDRINHILMESCRRTNINFNQHKMEYRNFYDFTVFYTVVLLSEEDLDCLYPNTPGGELNIWISQTIVKLQNLNIREVKHRKFHVQDFCHKCQFFGRLCTLTMERSRSSKDIVVRGIPLNMNEMKMRDVFSIYGYIMGIHQLPIRQGYRTKIAFITFLDPELALSKFNGQEF